MTKIAFQRSLDDENRLIDVVFIHGLGGDGVATWSEDAQCDYSFWPNWLADDLPDVGVCCVSYPSTASAFFGTTMSIVDRAKNLLELLRSNRIWTRPTIVIAHSMGGLILKQMLRLADGNTSYAAFAENLKGVVFIATPHHGSLLASYLSPLATLLRFTVNQKELQYAEPGLRDLNDWFRNNAAKTGLQVLTLAETKTIAGQLVVDQVCSDLGLPNSRLLPVDADHIQICKPGHEDAVEYIAIRDFIRGLARDIQSSHPARTVKAHDISIAASVYCDFPLAREEKPSPRLADQVVGYRSYVADGITKVSPSCPYFDKLRREDVLPSLKFMWSPFRWDFPSIDFKIANNSRRTVYLVKLIADVQRSQVDYRPIPVFRENDSFGLVLVTNEGWGRVISAEIAYDVLPDMTVETPSSSALPYRQSMKLDDGVLYTDIIDSLRDKGMKFSGERPQLKFADYGPFKPPVAYVVGEITIAYQDENQASTSRFRFFARVFIGSPNYGAFCPPTYSYDLMLETSESNYRMELDISQQILPGQCDRFLVKVAAEKSSIHSMALTLLDVGGDQFELGKFELEMFVPQSQSRYSGKRDTQPE